MISKSLKSLKTFTKKNPQIATIRIFIFAIAVAIIVNMLSGGQLYKSGLFLVLILVVLDIIKSKKKNKSIHFRRIGLFEYYKATISPSVK
ncbi:hypothetical protein JARBOU2402_30210 (plasmid) [Enterococcus faecium]